MGMIPTTQPSTRYCLLRITLIKHHNMNSRIRSLAKIRGSLLFVRQQRNVHIPAPTWSIQELDLTSPKPPMDSTELNRLSRLALITLEEDDEELGQNLSNMLHMIDQVSRLKLDNYDVNNASTIYDLPRGVTAAPLRPMEEESKEESNNFMKKEMEVSSSVWKTLLRPKTTRKGGRHDYFVIQTKRQEE